MAKVGKFCLAKRVKVEWLFQMVVYGRIWKNYPLNENAHLFSAMVIIF